MWYSVTIASSPSSEFNQCINTIECVQFESKHANIDLDLEKQGNSMSSQRIYFLRKIRLVYLEKKNQFDNSRH